MKPTFVIPAQCRASTSLLRARKKTDVDGRVEPGHDGHCYHDKLTIPAAW
jgi:hypothetical protein